jgi:hypothetical protein
MLRRYQRKRRKPGPRKYPLYHDLDLDVRMAINEQEYHSFTSRSLTSILHADPKYRGLPFEILRTKVQRVLKKLRPYANEISLGMQGYGLWYERYGYVYLYKYKRPINPSKSIVHYP